MFVTYFVTIHIYDSIDSLLGGGLRQLRQGQLVELVGPSASAKTQAVNIFIYFLLDSKIVCSI